MKLIREVFRDINSVYRKYVNKIEFLLEFAFEIVCLRNKQ